MTALCFETPPITEVKCVAPWLTVRFAAPQQVASWALVGGGLRLARDVVWRHVTDADLRPPVDARRWTEAELSRRGLPDAVCLLTSRDVGTFTEARVRFGGWEAHAITTVGLGNALRAGDPPGPVGRIGTINTLCHVNRPVVQGALLELMALVTEARALAVREAHVPSRISGAPASGTGTDCVVVAAPMGAPAAAYAGKHTALGHVVGAAVMEATVAGITRWTRDAQRRREEAQACPGAS
jgi:adenosylcobinamide amidohydrolase